MWLKLPSGRRVLVSPRFWWESPREALLTVRTAGAFHPSHVTTRLCLQLLEEHLSSTHCHSLLDVGCGCGILALAAAALGVERVVGVDIDPRAVRVSRDNAHVNGLATATHWITGSSTAVGQTFQCVVANLHVAVLEHLLDDLARLLSTDGTLVLSGFQDVHWHSLHAWLARRNLALSHSISGDFSFYGAPPSGSFTWLAVTARRRAPPAGQAPV